MESLYLIGGSGFVGKNLVDCLSHKYKITVFDKFIDTDFFSSKKDVRTIQLDLTNENIPSDFSTPDYIINFASVVTAERELKLFNELIETNLRIMLSLFERFKTDKKLKLFVQFGSSEEYGDIESPFKEDMREHPNSPYALVKQLTTNTGIMLYKNYGFPITVVRPENLFGPKQPKSKFIPYVIDKLMNNESLDVSPCGQKRDFIYITDFIFVLEKLLCNYSKCIGEIINISSGKSISLKSIIEFCKKELNSKSTINYGALPYRENEIMDLKCDVTKLQNIINEEINLDTKKRLKKYIKQNLT